jgi:hypothetical protein
MKLIMHIGTHKTGTSAFQKMCKFHKDLLASDGINFPSYRDWNQHSYAAWIAQKRELSELRLFFQSIYDESLELSCGITLISGEDFENFLVDINLASEFTKIALEVGFEELEWVVVQRNPFDYLQSLYAEMSKYKCILDYRTMAMSILRYGYVSVGTPNYNYHFVFEINKFAEIFKNYVSKKLIIIPFREFIEDFTGKVILSKLISDHSKKTLLEHSYTAESRANERASPEITELNYLANFLGTRSVLLSKDADQSFSDSNKQFYANLISHRLKRNALLLDAIKRDFDKRNF